MLNQTQADLGILKRVRISETWYQSSKRKDLRGEKVGPSKQRQVSPNEFRPSGRVSALRCRRQRVAADGNRGKSWHSCGGAAVRDELWQVWDIGVVWHSEA